MLEPKLKECKGIGKAISVKGCGTKVYKRTFLLFILNLFVYLH